MKLEFQIDAYESIYDKEQIVYVLKAGDIWCGYEDNPMVMYKKPNEQDWTVKLKKDFLKVYKKVSNY